MMGLNDTIDIRDTQLTAYKVTDFVVRSHQDMIVYHEELGFQEMIMMVVVVVVEKDDGSI